MARKTLYLIDGHAQIYRAYYAPFRALTAPSGEPTRAVHVFVQMLLGLLQGRKPDYLAMTMDVGDESVFRLQIDPEYKATRDKMPEDLPPQIDRIVTILQTMKIPILRQTGFEADDLMATLCSRYADKDLDVFLVSKDKDLDQILGDHVRMYDPGNDREIDVAGLVVEKGYGPDKAVEAQMLMGDSTDNIKGVPGVGPKKAALLLQKYGTLAEIIAHADELTPKLRENVLAFRDRMDVVRQLVTLRRDVEFDFDLDTADVARFDPAAAAPIFADLGLNRLLERVGVTEQGAEPRHVPPGQGRGLFADTEPEQTSSSPPLHPSSFILHPSPSAPDQELFPHVEETPGDYRLIDTEPALADLASKLAKVNAFAFDTETTGLNPATVDLVGISVAWEPLTGYYIPVRGIGNTVTEAAVRKHLGPIFEDAGVRKCGQNLKYDLVVLKSVGIEVVGIDFDTMLASFVLDSSRRSHGLDALALDLLHYRTIPAHELIGKGKNQTTFDKLPTERTCTYATEDADVAWRLRAVLERQMTDPELAALFRNLDMPLIEVLARMEHFGVAVDTDLLAKLSGQMADRLADLEHDIHEAAGHPFNINSTKQLAEVLFDERGLRVVKRTKTSRSTDAEVLATLAAETDDPIPRLVLEHRESAKLKGTYVDALPEMVSQRTGRIHPSFNQIGAITGRLSCSDPNLQNIPIRTEMGAKIRRAFVPGDDGNVLVKADYSQVELRVLAHFSCDKALSAAFIEDRDIHAFVASQIEGIPITEVTKQQRSRAKTVNFGIVYGQSAFGLSRQTGMTVSQAKAFIERYFQRYAQIRGFLDQCVAHARRHGYVKTLLGRRRAIPDITSRNQTARSAAERLAVNTVIQGTAADMIKKAMINIDHRIQSERRPSKMLIQVHDELVFEVPKERAEVEAAMIADEMTNAIKLNVPIKVDVGWGPNWLDVE
ncbi:MAG: DNA polymerase I [Phycisphaerae bacterium]|nr:DNA polymerase I [Phycisphaerae bacterium]